MVVSFFGNSACEVWRKYPCGPKLRKDNKNVIFEEVEEFVECINILNGVYDEE